jgi:hypothetical protein
MVRICIALSAIACCTFSLFAGKGSAQAPVNLLQNPGFEQGTVDPWIRDSWRGGVGLDVTKDKVHSGKFALKIQADTQSNDARVIQKIKAEPNSFYHISGYIATRNVEHGKVGGCISLNGTPYRFGNIEGSSDWQFVEAHFRTGPQAPESLAVAPRLGFWANDVKGMAFFDDISLTKIDSASGKDYIAIEAPQPPSAPAPAAAAAPAAPAPKANTGFVIVLIAIVGVVLMALVVLIAKGRKPQAKNTNGAGVSNDKNASGA